MNPYITTYRLTSLPASPSSSSSSSSTSSPPDSYAYGYFDLPASTSSSDDESSSTPAPAAPAAAAPATSLFASNTNSLTTSLRVFRRSKGNNRNGEYGPWALVHRENARYVPGLDTFFCFVVFEVADGRLEVVSKLAASPGADATRQPEVLQGVGEYQLKSLEESDEQHVIGAGAFGSVSVREWTARAQRVFVKQQERSSQFFIEVAVLSTATDLGLPTPRLLALHQDKRTGLTTTVLELSKGRPANKFFAVEQSLEVKLRAAMMFAFALQCCHRHGIVHSDVALKNFMTDGESCFEIVDFGLSVVGQLGHQSAKAKKHKLVGSFPYPHKSVACMQAAPELFVLHEASAASDMWQFAFALLDIFLGSSTDGPALSPFLQKHVVPHFPAPLAGADDAPRYRADMVAFVSEFLPTLRDLIPGPSDRLPEPMRDLIVGCLHPNPNRRVGTEEIIETAGALLGEPKLSQTLAGCVSLPEASLRLEGTAFAALLPTPEQTMSGDVVSGVRALLEATSDDVDLASRLGRGVWSIVLEGLARNDVIRRIDLYANGIGAPEHIKALVRALSGPRSVSRLEQIHLGSNLIDDSGAKALAQLLGARNSHIGLLDIWNNEIGDEGLCAVALALHDDECVYKLGLRSNSFGAEGAQALGAMLRVNSTLREVNVGRNNLGSDGVVGLVEGVAENSTLEKLWLREVAIDAKAATAVSSMLRTNSSLVYLNLRNASLGAESSVLLLHGLRDNRTVRELNLRQNECGDSGAVALAELLADDSCVLTHVDVARNNIGPDGTAALFRAVEANHTLVELDASRCKATGEAAQAMASAVRAHPTLQQLKIDRAALGEEGCALLFQALEDNSTLLELDVRRNQAGHTGGMQLAESLKVNRTLRTLQLEINALGQAAVDALLVTLSEHNDTVKEMRMKSNNATVEEDALDPDLKKRIRV